MCVCSCYTVRVPSSRIFDGHPAHIHFIQNKPFAVDDEIAVDAQVYSSWLFIRACIVCCRCLIAHRSHPRCCVSSRRERVHHPHRTSSCRAHSVEFRLSAAKAALFNNNRTPCIICDSVATQSRQTKTIIGGCAHI